MFRKIHRYTGLVALIFLIVLALSGLLLHHPFLLGASPEQTLSLAVDPQNARHLFKGTPSGLFASDDGGQSWSEVPMLFAAEKAIDIAYAPDNSNHIYVALEDMGLIRSTDGGIIWEEVPLGFVPLAEGVRLQQLTVGPAGTIHLWTSGGHMASTNSGQTWTPIGQSRLPGRDFYTLIHQIHTGYFFTSWFYYLYDIAAIGLVFLAISGLYIWLRAGKKKRRVPVV